MRRSSNGMMTNGGNTTFILKACPRCLGDLALQHDPITGSYYSCLQCGVEVELKAAGVAS